tara:strand:- start:12247 stop:13404 length:1158 start_codon:yes stop_codon:yes gene_type:complete
LRNLIDKYLNDSIDDIEIERLKVWLENEKNQTIFKRMVQSHYEINLGLQEIDLDREYSILLKKLEGNKTVRQRSYTTWYKIAAIFIGILGLGYLMHMITKNTKEIYVDENTITIRHDNGSMQVIKEDGSLELLDSKGNVIGKQKGSQLDYKNVVDEDSNTTVNESLTYNELIVPNGKRMKLILSDSTIVHINSGTRLKYPVKFITNQDRKVFLEGEAFFEVTKSKTNPFIVNADKIDVRVLGTKFNVSSYPNDHLVSTVLVEGLVELNATKDSEKDDEKYLLIPGQIASWDKSINNMQIAKTDINEYTSWINGQIIFKVRPFPEILKVLERHYDVSITNNYRFLDSQQFFAKFDTETIEQVMTYFQSSIPFSYTRVGDEIIINEP